MVRRPGGPAPHRQADQGRAKLERYVPGLRSAIPGGAGAHPIECAAVDALGSDLPNGFASIPIGGSTRARFYMNFADPSERSLLWTVRFDR